MRRAFFAVGAVIAVLAVSAPASAFAHDRVHNVYLHTLLDVLTLAVASAPLWTAYFWGGQRKALLIALIAFVQLPVGIIGFVPISDPWLHSATLVGSMVITALAIRYTRRLRQAERSVAASAVE